MLRREFYLSDAPIIAAWVLYAISFILPAFSVTVFRRPSFFFCYEAFWISLCSIEGAPSFRNYLFFAAWLANPCFCVATWYVLRLHYGTASIAGVSAFVMSAIILGVFWSGVDQPLIGYYAWFASMVLMTMGCALNRLAQRRGWLDFGES
jgi:hypothetical protein